MEKRERHEKGQPLMKADVPYASVHASSAEATEGLQRRQTQRSRSRQPPPHRKGCSVTSHNATNLPNTSLRGTRNLLLNHGSRIRKRFFVYIMASRSRTLYVGVTSDLEGRVYQHKNKLLAGFTSRYNITRLVYFEEACDAFSAMEREKQIKAWARAKKVALIESANQTWQDLSEEW